MSNNNSPLYTPLKNSVRTLEIDFNDNDDDNDNERDLGHKKRPRGSLDLDFADVGRPTPQRQLITENSRHLIMQSFARGNEARSQLMDPERKRTIQGCPHGLQHDIEIQDLSSRCSSNEILTLKQFLLSSKHRDSIAFKSTELNNNNKCCFMFVGGQVVQSNSEDKQTDVFPLTSYYANKCATERTLKTQQGPLLFGMFNLKKTPLTDKNYDDDRRTIYHIFQQLQDEEVRKKHPLAELFTYDVANDLHYMQVKLYGDHLKRFFAALQYFEEHKSSDRSEPILLCSGLYLQNSRRKDYKVLASQDGFPAVNGVFLVGYSRWAR